MRAHSLLAPFAARNASRVSWDCRAAARVRSASTIGFCAPKPSSADTSLAKASQADRQIGTPSLVRTTAATADTGMIARSVGGQRVVSVQ